MALSALQDRSEGSVQTVGLGTTTALSYAVPAGARVMVRALIKAKDAASEDSAQWEVRAAVRLTGGVAVIIGAVLSLLAEADVGAATWLATLAVSGTDVRVNVTGQLTKTINWDCVLLIDQDF